MYWFYHWQLPENMNVNFSVCHAVIFVFFIYNITKNIRVSQAPFTA